MSTFSTVLEPVKDNYGTAKNYIDGEWVESTSEQLLDVINPATDEAIGKVPLSTREEVDSAIDAAQEAFEEWRETPPFVRARYMFRLRDLMEKHYEELARILVQEHGKVIDEARGSVRRAIENVETAAGIPSLMMGYNLEDGAAAGIDEEAIIQPLGVFAAVCPYNFPAMVPFWFFPYALATGNTFVLKPSEQVPLSQQRVFEIIDELDLPPGALNLVNGAKDAVNALLENPKTKGVSFVGSSTVAKYVYRRAAQYGKRAQCQGAAKNFLVVLPDANLEANLPNMLSSFFGCTGQRCLAGANLVAVGEVYEKLRDAFLERASKIRVGYGLDESAQMGPLISRSHMDRVLGYIQKGLDEGAKLLLDGRNVKVEGFEKGYFVGPTVFDNVTPEMTIAREEIFGPVVSIMRVADLDEAIELANTSPYGNATSLYTSSGKAAREYRYRVQCGNIGINLGIAAPMAYFPFGGYKDSFYGDLHGQGKDGISFYTERKIVISRWI